ncbi:MAG: BA14K family protein, partial [Hyphomicrobium sp.]|nr:BA14K family protein [Hyphomicrobium sp.]
ALPRIATTAILEPILDALETLRTEILKYLEQQIILQNTAGNAGHIERHKQNSKPDSTSDFEPRFEKKPGGDGAPPRPVAGWETSAAPEDEPLKTGARMQAVRRNHGHLSAGADPHKPYPLPLVLQACPEIVPFGPGGSISNWRDFMTAATPILGQPDDAVADAVAAPSDGPATPACDVKACSTAYSSFRSSDCTYQPYSGPRRLCEWRFDPSSSIPRIARAAAASGSCDADACGRRFRSFDSATCTYQPYGGGPRAICDIKAAE